MEAIVNWYRSDIEKSKQVLEALESGRMQTRSKTAGEDWVDTTAADIEMYRQRIAEIEGLLAKYA